MKLKEKTFKRRRLYKGKSVDFYADLIKLPNKKTALREYITHPGAVSVIPFLNTRDIVLVKQYRYPVKKITYELPAGKVSPGENLLGCAKRELMEETGFKTGRIKKLISYWPSPAFSTELLHIYVAGKLTPVESSPDEDEFIDRIILPFDEALKWVYKGKIRDSKTIIALFSGNLLRSKPFFNFSS
jgi:ADP-ribose pyrophosphatase